MGKNADEYLGCKDYLGHPIGEDGFSRFFREKNQEYYFAYIENGEVIFRSEGYTTESGRDNGIASVKKNEPIEKRYKLLEMGKGKWGLSLRAGNHKEIAITCPKDSETAAWALLPSKRAEAALALRAAAKGKSKKVIDEYLSCDAYKSHERTKKHPDFSTFENEGEYYFAMLAADDTVIFRSEGYTTESGRDNGIASVKKNESIEKRYKLLKISKGKWVLSLRAGNHQEIAITCPYDSEAAAWALLPSKRAEAALALKAAARKSNKSIDEYLSCDLYKNHKRTKAYPDFSTFDYEGESYFAMLGNEDELLLRSEGYTSVKGRDNGIQSVMKNRAIEGRYKVVEEAGKYYACLKAGNHQEIGRSCAYSDEAAAWASTTAWIPKAALAKGAPQNSRAKDDDYLICDSYKGHERSVSYPDFSTFEKDELYYFAMLNEEGDVALRSEGYTTVSSRNNGIRSVIKNKDIEKRRSTIERFGHYFVILKAGNHQEIARSCALKDEAAALGLFGLAPIAAAAIPIIKEEPVSGIVETPDPTPVDKEDDYLACAEYKDRFVNDKVNNVALFKFTDNQFYFVLYDEDGEVKLRSEGFRTAKERDQELSGVLRFHDKPEMYERIQKGTHYIDVLKDDTGREVGRSCIKKEKVAAIIPPAVPVVGAVAAAGAAAIVTPDPIVAKEPVVAAPVATPAAAGSGCMNWKWLLLALLLLLLLLWLCRGCLGCGTDGVLVPPIDEVGTNTETTTGTDANTNTETATIESTTSNIDAAAIAAAAEKEAEAAAAALAAKEAVAAAKAAVKPKYDLESIYYDYNKWDLRGESMTELDRMVEILKSDETLQGEFLGHTDTRGSQKLNDRLSRKRAQAALNYVVSQGISKSRLTWKKFSEENPKAKNDTESEQKLQLNRRVDLRILKNGKVVEDTEKEVRSVD